MKKLVSVALAASLAFTPGCGSMIFRNPQSVLVTSNVRASIKEGALGLGVAPGRVTLDRSSGHVLTLEAEGREARVVRVESSLSWWRIAVSVILNGGNGIFTLFI